MRTLMLALAAFIAIPAAVVEAAPAEAAQYGYSRANDGYGPRTVRARRARAIRRARIERARRYRYYQLRHRGHRGGYRGRGNGPRAYRPYR